MKTSTLILALALLSGCVETTVIDPLTGVTTTTKTPAPGVLPFVGGVIQAYSPRAIYVREEKSGRISKEEIKARFHDELAR